MSRTAVSRNTQRGSALLIVFVMAAAVAIMLYKQMPRVAFESQRERELLLIERGAQFKRAIQLYYVTNKKWPSKIEDLENTNDKRYLRRRYVDPMTGKDEWRMIHTNGVMLTDSLVQKMPDPANDKNKDLLASNTPGTGNPGDPNAPPDVNAAVRQRPSDRTPLPGSNQLPPGVDMNDPNAVAAYLAAQQQQAQQNGQNPQMGPNGQPVYPGGVPGQPNFQAGVTPGMPGFNPALAGQMPFNPQIPGQPPFPGQPGQNVPGQNNVVKVGPDGQLIPVNPQQPGVNGNPQQPGVNGQFNPQFPGQTNPGFNNAGINNGGFNNGGFNNGGFNNTAGAGQPAVAPNNAVQMINSMLTTPRQGPAPTSSPFQNSTNGGIALAGVASKFEGPSILVYGDRQKYNEWEFVFDLKQNTLGQQQTGVQGAPNGPNGQRPPGIPGGMPPMQPGGSPFGPGGAPINPGMGTGTGGIGPIRR